MESQAMLVLSRKVNETILIANNIRIKVVNISGGQVRLGIEAPGDVKVMREELLSRHRETREAAPSTQLPRKPQRPRAVGAIV
jgi:carbon storage regulator